MTTARLKRLIPKRLKLLAGPPVRLLENIICSRRIAKIPISLASRDLPAVFYAGMSPSRNELAQGGRVKLIELSKAYPESRDAFNIFYLVSSAPPPAAVAWMHRCRQLGGKVVLNQNGVAYPGWYGPGWQLANHNLKKLIHLADYVVYQSRFCKTCADKFLGERKGSWDIVYNAVDTEFFTPKQRAGKDNLVLLLGGNQYQYYRFESALNALATVVRNHPKVKLLVTGTLSWLPDEAKCTRIAQELLLALDLRDNVVFTGQYLQNDAPDIFRQADILLHTKYNDPCPTVVLEAMACGLPVVYSDSGGVPELVGPDAGIGITAPLDWKKDIVPDPMQMAESILAIAESRRIYADAARQRAVDHFGIKTWIERHGEIFRQVLRDE